MKISLKNLKSDKYSWLHKTELYKNFTFDEEDEEIDIGYICTKNCSDINLLLKTIDFWDIDNLSFTFFDRLLENKPFDELIELYSRSKSNRIKFLLDICNADEDDIFDIAFDYSRTDCISFLYKSGLNCQFNSKIKKEAFRKCPLSFEEIKNLEDEYYFNLIKNMKSFECDSLICEIFDFGYNKCIEYLIDINYKKICEWLCRFGMLEYLKVSFSKGLKIDQHCVEACGIEGNVECLKFALENGEDTRLNGKLVKNASDNYNIEILRYVKSVAEILVINYSKIDIEGNYVVKSD